METQSRWTNATGIAVAAVLLLWTGPAWAGYMNWDVNIDETKRERTDVPVEGPIRFQGTAEDVDSKPAYEDPPKAEWIEMSVRDPSGNSVPGSVQIEVVETEQVDKQTRRLDFELEWRPKSMLRSAATYSFELRELYEVHGNQEYKTPVTGSLTTEASGGDADTGTPTGGESDTGVAKAPDTGGSGDSPDSGASWNDAGGDTSSSGSAGGTREHDGSNRRACSQTNGSLPLGTLVLTLALFAGAGLIRRRDAWSKP